MRQTFDEHTDPSFGPKHVPLIREQMRRLGLDGFLIPHEDEHQNEYLPEANDRLAWATGFTGSAGAAAVTTDKAAVFVDGRYTLQVRSQVDPSLFEIRDLVEGGVPAWLEQTARPGQTIGYDPRLHSPDALHWLRAAAGKAGAQLKPVDANPVDLAWGQERPPQPQAAVVPHPLEYAGEDSASKRTRVGEEIAAAGADAAVMARWINDAENDRQAAEADLARLAPDRPPHRLRGQRTPRRPPGDRLSTADPAVMRDVYRELGLRAVWQPRSPVVDVSISPELPGQSKEEGVRDSDGGGGGI